MCRDCFHADGKYMDLGVHLLIPCHGAIKLRGAQFLSKSHFLWGIYCEEYIVLKWDEYQKWAHLSFKAPGPDHSYYFSKYRIRCSFSDIRWCGRKCDIGYRVKFLRKFKSRGHGRHYTMAFVINVKNRKKFKGVSWLDL